MFRVETSTEYGAYSSLKTFVIYSIETHTKRHLNQGSSSSLAEQVILCSPLDLRPWAY